MNRLGECPRQDPACWAPTSRGLGRIGEQWSSRETRPIAELAIDADEDRLLRALLVTMLRERQYGGWRS
jgi:hypothetical protein